MAKLKPLLITENITDGFIQSKIPVGDIFFNDNRHSLSGGYDSRLAALMDVDLTEDEFNNLPVVYLPADKLIPTQKFVNKDNIEKVHKSGKGNPHIVEIDGEHFILDGHHRSAARILNGESKIPVHTYKVDMISIK